MCGAIKVIGPTDDAGISIYPGATIPSQLLVDEGLNHPKTDVTIGQFMFIRHEKLGGFWRRYIQAYYQIMAHQFYERNRRAPGGTWFDVDDDESMVLGTFTSLTTGKLEGGIVTMRSRPEVFKKCHHDRQPWMAERWWPDDFLFNVGPLSRLAGVPA